MYLAVDQPDGPTNGRSIWLSDPSGSGGRNRRFEAHLTPFGVKRRHSVRSSHFCRRQDKRAIGITGLRRNEHECASFVLNPPFSALLVKTAKTRIPDVKVEKSTGGNLKSEK